jgi:nitrite reductase/ring-hydroxylating ferredoxin subunit
MGFFKRLFGICETAPPTDSDGWNLSGGKIEIQLDRVSELANKGGAIRLEGKGTPEKVLVIHGHDGAFHAFKNRCTHFGRRIDPFGANEQIRCCSINKSTFDYTGKLLSGPAKGPLTRYHVEHEDGKLTVDLERM